MADGHKHFPGGPHLGQLWCVWDCLDTSVGVGDFGKQLDLLPMLVIGAQFLNFFSSQAHALGRSGYPGTLCDNYVHGCRQFDRKCVPTFSPTGKRLTITSTAWQNLFFKDHITNVGLSGITLQV